MAGLRSGSFESTTPVEPPESLALTSADSSLGSSFLADIYGTEERYETLDAERARQEPVDPPINDNEVTNVQNTSGAEQPGGLQPDLDFQNRTESPEPGEVAGSSRSPENPPLRTEFPQAPQWLSGEGQSAEGRSVGGSLALKIGKAIAMYSERHPGEKIPQKTAEKLLGLRLEAAESGYLPYTEAKDHKKGTLGSIHASIRSWLKNDQYIELQRSRLKHQALADADAAYKDAGDAYKLIEAEYSVYQEVLTTAEESFLELQRAAKIPGRIEEARSEILERLNELDNDLNYSMGSAPTPEGFKEKLQRTMGVIQRADDAFIIARGDLKIVEGLRFSLDVSSGQGGIFFRHRDVRDFNRTLQRMNIEDEYKAFGNKMEALLGSVAELRRKINEP